MPTTESGAHKLSDLLGPQPGRSRTDDGLPRIHPEVDTKWVTEEEAQRRVTQAMMAAYAANVADIPGPFLRLLRTGTAGQTETVTISERQITVVAAKDGHGPTPDPETERTCWDQLRDVVGDIAAQTRDASPPETWIRPDLPDRIATATWNHHGATIRVHGARRGWLRGRRKPRGPRPATTYSAAVSVGLAAFSRIGAGLWAAQDAAAAGAAVVGTAIVLGASSPPTEPHPRLPAVQPAVLTGEQQMTGPPRPHRAVKHRSPARSGPAIAVRHNLRPAAVVAPVLPVNPTVRGTATPAPLTTPAPDAGQPAVGTSPTLTGPVNGTAGDVVSTLAGAN